MSIETFLNHKGTKRSDGLDLIDRELLQLMADGHKVEKIADLMRLEVYTVDNRKCRLYKKLNVNNAPHAIAWGFRNKIIE